MNTRKMLAGAACLIAVQALAAPPKAVLLDFSTASLIDSATATQLLDEGIPAKVWRVYPRTKWGYVTQVEGGVTAEGICVITARVMMVALSPSLKVPLFRPEKIATAYGARTAASGDQCRALAKTKLVEATQGVVSSLVRN